MDSQWVDHIFYHINTRKKKNKVSRVRLGCGMSLPVTPSIKQSQACNCRQLAIDSISWALTGLPRILELRIGDCYSLFETQRSTIKVLSYAYHQLNIDREMGHQLGSSIDTTKEVSQQPLGPSCGPLAGPLGIFS